MGMWSKVCITDIRIFSGMCNIFFMYLLNTVNGSQVLEK